ncbi:MAG: LpxL/LpxP family acyltransferase [bacterium]
MNRSSQTTAQNHTVRFRWSWLLPRHWLSWLGVILLAFLALVPRTWRQALSKRLGLWMYRKNHKRCHVVLTNLALCFPDDAEDKREALAKQHFQAYVSGILAYSEYIFLPKRWLYKKIELQGKAQLDQSIADGKAIILLIGHTTMLEFVSVAMGQYYQTYGSYKPFANPVFDWLIFRGRLRHIGFVVAREAGMMTLMRELKTGKLLGFLPDEDHGAHYSVFVDFFGVKKATLNTPARMARLSKADCYPVMAFFDETTQRYCIKLGEVLRYDKQAPEHTFEQTMNQRFEALIREHPEQYMWLLKLFKTQPDTEAKRY